MARGNSGRLVVEVTPGFKRRLHSALAADGRTLKSWFIEAADSYLKTQERRSLLPGLFAKKRGREDRE
jgi:hypothetical protein